MIKTNYLSHISYKSCSKKWSFLNLLTKFKQMDLENVYNFYGHFYEKNAIFIKFTHLEKDPKKRLHFLWSFLKILADLL